MFNKEKYKKISLAFLALGLSFSTLAHADTSNGEPNIRVEYTKVSDDGMGMSDSDSDRELAKKIHDKLSSGWFSEGYKQVNFQVNNGDVLLQGSVKTMADKDKVEKEIRDIKGVRSLNSRLNVVEQASKSTQQREFPKDMYRSSADDQLNQKIRDKVSRGWLWNSYKEVVLNTSDGVVTLEGTVGTTDDQQKLITEIQKVDGVKSVRSNLNIKK